MELVEVNLTEAEMIFYNLLNEERLFNPAKFKKALQQQRARKAEEYNQIIRHKMDEKEKKKNAKGKGKGRSHTPLQGQPSTSKTLKDLSPSGGNPGSPNTLTGVHSDGGKPIIKKGVQDKKPKEKIKKKQKVLGHIDVFGEQYQMATRIEDYNFFTDFNYGDIVIGFKNPFFDFQLKERQEIEMYQYNHLKELRNATMARLNMSARETKKMEANNAKMIQEIKDKFKKLTEDSKLNTRIDLQEAYDFYSKYMNLKPENQIESRKEEKQQKQAFANALIYFSDRYYVNDMGRIKPGKQPYSDCSSQSLKDFLMDSIFEFNLFHIIAKRKFYTRKDTNDRPIVGGTLEENPLAHHLMSKPIERPGLIKKIFSKVTLKDGFEQVMGEETNFFFIKRPEGLDTEDPALKQGDDKRTYKEIAADQYKAYLDLTVRLNDASLYYYRDFLAKKEAAALAEGDEQPMSPGLSRKQSRKKTRLTNQLHPTMSSTPTPFDCKLL